MSSHTGSCFYMGNNTLKVPYSLHAENRERLINSFTKSREASKPFILLQGGKSETLYDTDSDRLFRQEAFFQWAFGVMEPDFYGTIDIQNKQSILFIPRLPPDYAIWLGTIQPPSFFKEKYEVDEVRYVDELESFFSSKKPSTIYTLKGLNTDSGNLAVPAHFEGIEKFKVDEESLFPIFVENRVIKSAKEIEVLRYVNKVSSEAHKEVMRYIRPGMKEYQLESVFLHRCYHDGGCRHPSYTCICATGPNSAILHYGHSAAPNDRTLNDGDMCLFDMGVEYHCYCADITCSFPANGKFTDDQKAIYNAVLNAQRAVEAALKPGVKWTDMHRLAEGTILSSLLSHHILHNGTIQQVVDAHLGEIFMPHGLGHFLGLATHDVGGYPGSSSRIQEPGIRKLRTSRTIQEGMCITVEPGCYFIDVLLDKALANPAQSQYINEPVLKRFRGFGGVRLEDDVIVTKDGIEVLTQVPRTVEEVEKWMAGH